MDGMNNMSGMGNMNGMNNMNGMGNMNGMNNMGNPVDMEEIKKSNKKSVRSIGWLFMISMSIHWIFTLLMTYVIKVDMPAVLSIILGQLLILVPVIIYMMIMKINPIKEYRFNKMNIWSALLCIVLTYTMWPVIALVNIISMFFATNVISDTITSTSDALGIIPTILLVALTPAFVEEISFRGVFLKGFKGVKPIAYILVSGLLFGLAHMNFNQMLYAFTLGVILAILNEASGSILSSVIVHFVFNASSTLLSILLPKLMDYMDKYMAANGMATSTTNTSSLDANSLSNAQLLSSFIVYIPLAIGGIVLSGLLIYAIAKLNKREDKLIRIFKKSEEEILHPAPKQSFVSIPLIIGIVLCIAYCVVVEIV